MFHSLTSSDLIHVQVFTSFESLVHENHGVVRKMEYDWNMAYLARATNDTQANISKDLFISVSIYFITGGGGGGGATQGTSQPPPPLKNVCPVLG